MYERRTKFSGLKISAKECEKTPIVRGYFYWIHNFLEEVEINKLVSFNSNKRIFIVRKSVIEIHKGEN